MTFQRCQNVEIFPKKNISKIFQKFCSLKQCLNFFKHLKIVHFFSIKIFVGQEGGSGVLMPVPFYIGAAFIVFYFILLYSFISIFQSGFLSLFTTSYRSGSHSDCLWCCGALIGVCVLPISTIRTTKRQRILSMRKLFFLTIFYKTEIRTCYGSL